MWSFDVLFYHLSEDSCIIFDECVKYYIVFCIVIAELNFLDHFPNEIALCRPETDMNKTLIILMKSSPIMKVTAEDPNL